MLTDYGVCIVYHSIIEFVCVRYISTYSSIWSIQRSFVSLVLYSFCSLYWLFLENDIFLLFLCYV